MFCLCSSVNSSPLLVPSLQDLFLFVRVSGSAVDLPVANTGLRGAHFSCPDLDFGFAPLVSPAAIGSPRFCFCCLRPFSFAAHGFPVAADFHFCCPAFSAWILGSTSPVRSSLCGNWHPVPRSILAASHVAVLRISGLGFMIPCESFGPEFFTHQAFPR
jgi:hypothetical protein